MDEKTKLLIIINRFVISGQTPDVISNAWYLKDTYDIKIFYGEKQPDEIEAFYLLDIFPGLQIQKIPFLKKSFNLVNDLKTFFFLYKNIRENKYDIVHTHGSKSGFIGRLAAYIAGTKGIIHTYHGHLFKGYFNQLKTKSIIAIERFLGKLSSVCVVLSEQQRKEIAGTYKIIPPQKAALIPLGFDIKAYQESLSAGYINELFSKLSGKKIIAIIGRVVPVKNHLFFLHVAEELLKRRLNTVFLIVGDGTDKTKLQTWLSQKKLAFSEKGYLEDSPFIFTSWQTNMANILPHIDIVTLTSYNEGTPMSLIEAQFFKKPVVAVDAGGVKDTFIDNKTGFLITSHYVKEMADKIELLIKDKALAEQMGTNGHNFVAKNFSKEIEISAYKNLYNRYNNKT